MKEEEVLKLILESPEAASGFDKWMNLQWFEAIAEVLLVGVLVVLAFGVVVFIIRKLAEED